MYVRARSARLTTIAISVDFQGGKTTLYPQFEVQLFRSSLSLSYSLRRSLASLLYTVRVKLLLASAHAHSYILATPARKLP